MIKNKRRNKTAVAGALILTATAAVTGIFAYLTASDSKQNTFTVGDVKIDLKEDKWDALERLEDTNGDNKIDGYDVPEKAKHMYPTQTIEKDPKVINEGNNAAWIYLQAEVPKENLIVADTNGALLNAGEAVPSQLYIYEVNGIDKEGDWEFLASDLSDDSKNVYLYAAKQAVQPGAATGTLFDEVSMLNIVEGQIDSGLPKVISIMAYAIQEGNTGDKIDAWNKFFNQASGEEKDSIQIPEISKE